MEDTNHPRRRNRSSTTWLGAVIALTAAILMLALTPTPASADDTIGGFRSVRHWAYGEIQANKAATVRIANASDEVCGALGFFGGPGKVLEVYCQVQMTWWAHVARTALQNGRCFRVVIPAYNGNWAYPSSYYGSWCR